MSQTSGGSDKPIASTLGKPDPNRIVKIRFSKPLAEKVRQQILANRKSAGASLGEAGGQAVSPTPSKVAMASDSKLEWEGKRKRVGATPSNSDKESAAERSKKRGTGVPAAAGVSDAELIADVKEEIAGAGVRRSSRKKKGAETAAALTQEEGENDESNSDSGSGSEEDSDDEGEEESEMTEEQAKEALKKAQERMTRETLSTEIEELNMKPPNATTAAWGRKVEIPLGYCFPGDSVDLGDGLEPWSVNSRQVSAAGVKAAEENFEEHGYEPEMGFMLGVVRIGGKRVPLTQEDRDAWDEVERERVETFEKKYTELAKKGGKDTPEKREAKFMVEEVIGYRVHMTDGQNR